MSKYGSLQRIISSHVREEQKNGGSGFGPFYFFLFLLLVFIAGLVISIENKKGNTPSPTLETPQSTGGNEGEGVGE